MPLSGAELQQMLELLVRGERTVGQVQLALQSQLAAESGPVALSANGDVRIDLDRSRRCGFPEVVYAPGKSNEAIGDAFQSLLEDGRSCLATRCTPEQTEFLHHRFPEAICNSLARTVRLPREEAVVGRVVVVTAGTSDRPVAEEVLETLRWMSVETELLVDVGVAGPQRLLQVKHQFDNAQALVVVAGMEGALPSVVAGWVACPVIAVPTSVGYGASFGGVSALLGMLNSCAANVAVVNIDSGFKGGYLAGMIVRQSRQPE